MDSDLNATKKLIKSVSQLVVECKAVLGGVSASILTYTSRDQKAQSIAFERTQACQWPDNIIEVP